MEKNRVIVELKNYNYESLEKFKTTVTDSPLASFVQDQQIESIADVNVGAGYTSSIGRRCSYGYRAKNSSGVSGIVTVAHCFDAIVDGVFFTNLVRTNLNATNGDSSGIVMTEPTLLNDDLDTAGIAIAVNKSGSALIAKASEINFIFGLSRY